MNYLKLYRYAKNFFGLTKLAFNPETVDVIPTKGEARSCDQWLGSAQGSEHKKNPNLPLWHIYRILGEENLYKVQEKSVGKRVGA